MASDRLSVLIVFLEGLASFASPCVLPLLPVYLSYLAGASLEEIEGDKKRYRTMVLHSFGFVLGLSLVFIGLGATASVLGKFLYIHAEALRKISGLIVIVFGLHHAGLIHLGFLNYDKRMDWKDSEPKFFNSILLGVSFSFGWTPCVGPILASVLMMAGNTATVAGGIRLLAVYSLGMSIPFIVTALTLNFFIGHMKVIYRHFHRIKLISGLLLVVMGILIYTNYLYKLSAMLS